MEVATRGCMSYTVVLSVLALALALGLTIGIMIWWVRRPISGRRADGAAALPLFGHEHASLWLREDEDDGEMADIIASRTERAAGATAPNWSRPAPSAKPAPAATAVAEMSTNGRVGFALPTDRTLQFLSGWLEIVGGRDVGREIRFVRLPGNDPVEITFGRLEGEPYRHVQLHDATVSRQHACVRLRDGSWWLENLSETNPVRLNGVPLLVHDERRLVPADRIDLGEVVLRFHA